MAGPEITIDVDETTGVWRVDALPMILVPQHFFNNNHYAVEETLGPARYAEILRPAGYRSAYHWCQKEAEHHGISGLAVFAHYMKRLSQRGWGRFGIQRADVDAGRFLIRVDNSSFVDEARRGAGRKLCWMFAAWLEGSLRYVRDEAGKSGELAAREIQCAAEGFDHCLFEVEPTPRVQPRS